MKTAAFALAILVATGAAHLSAQGEPVLVPDVVEYAKLIPLLPEPPAGWKAEKPEGSTSDDGGFKLTNVHREYQKGDGEHVPMASINILDLAASPEYVTATTASWTSTNEGGEGYSKPVTIDGNPAFETFEKDDKHSTLWIVVAKRYLVQFELQGEDPKELQEWAKRVDLKKLAEIKG
jgi:hypothetical protein